MKQKKILFATANAGKLKDVKEIFKDLNIELVSLLDFVEFPEIEETGDTFEKNAFLKAETAYNFFQIPVIADDSGLVVDQLNGRPGVYSARYAGLGAGDKENNEKLISELRVHPQPHTAKYVCVAVYFDGKDIRAVSGQCAGRIIEQGRGENGFGYDPYFIPEGYELTMGEMSLQEKNLISHRRKAFEQLKITLRKL